MKNLNRVMLIGNVTKDPELKYTPQGTAICNLTVATNRDWKDSTGQAKTEATFTKVVAWGKLGEIMSQYLKKGGKVYIAGRLSNRSWKDQQNVTHYMTEVVADDMILLDSRPANVADEQPEPEPETATGSDMDFDFGNLDLDSVASTPARK